MRLSPLTPLALVLPTLAAADGGSSALISEIRIDQDGTDNDEYFELAGTGSLDGLFYIVIGDGTGGSGVVESITDLSGQAFGASGFFVVAEASFSIGTADLTATLGFENSDNVTHLLVSDFTGTLQEDLDTDDDGILDVTPWTGIVDSVALVETVGSGDLVYSANQVGPDGGNVPAHVFTCSGVFQIGLFDLSDDTPGAANACGGGPSIDASLSEIRIDQPSNDDDEYFELAGSGSLDGVTYIVIGDGAAGSGVIEAVVDLTGQSFDASGYFVAAEATFTIGAANLTTTLDFENSDNVTHLLVENFTGLVDDDLDVDDDGVLDTTPWDSIIDSVAFIETVGSGDQVYSANQVGPDGTFVPGHISLCPFGWRIGDFDPASGEDTPGAGNFCPPPTVDATISEFRVDQTSTDNDEYFELAGSGSLDGATYLVIGDGSAGSGVIEAVVDLTGSSIGASGFFVAAEASYTLGTADLTTSLNFENGDTVTHLLVRGFSGANGQDLDTDDDGFLDVTPWFDVLDSVSLVAPSSTDLPYSTDVVGPAGDFGPAHVYDCGGEWRIGAFAAFAFDTPGEANACTGVGQNYCVAQPNSAGPGAQISASGSNSLTANDLVLEVAGLPTILPNNGWNYFVAATSTENTPMGVGAGTLCVGGVIGRFVAPGEVQNGGMTGTSSLSVDLGNMPAPLNPAVQAGETLYFQNYYRDGAGSNLSNGLAITFVL